MKLTPDSRKQVFSRADEIATPYYYSVFTGASRSQRIRTEVTATDHCGYLRFTFSRAAKPLVLIEGSRKGVSGYIRVDQSRREVTGYNSDRMDSNLGPFTLPHFKGYFIVEFSEPFQKYGTYTGLTAAPENHSAKDSNVGAYVGFSPKRGKNVSAKVGTSFISVEQARANLKAEIPDWQFETVREGLKDVWNQKLGIVTIEGATKDQRAIFYTGLFHALLYPKLFSENGRYYSAFDDQVHRGISYTAYSLWDTFRAENSLITLFAPERVNGMVNALLQDYREGGWMPKWPNPSYTNIMVGTHADAVVAEAINKGFHGFDYKLAYDAVSKDAMIPPDGDTKRLWLDREEHTPYEARAGLTYSKQLGYVPVDKTAEAAASTLEDAYDDWAVAQVAMALGKKDEAPFYI